MHRARKRYLCGFARRLLATRGLKASGLESLSGCLCSRLAGFTLTRVGLALALDAGWLVVLAALCLREQAILLHFSGEFLKGRLKRIALFDDYLTHA